MLLFYRFLLSISIFFLSFSTCFAEDYVLFSGNASFELSSQVAKNLNIELGSADVGKFNDGEISIKINESVRGKNVYIIQSITKSANNSINDNLMELYLLIRTLKRSNAASITAIIPYFGYSRQDRKMESRVPISASDVAMLFEKSGVDRIVAIDLHAGQIQGFFHNVPVDNIYGSIFMAPYIASLNLKNPVIVSPDAGGVTRAKKFRDLLSTYGIDADIAMIIKQREQAGVIASVNLVGKVKDRDAIIVDDICDTGGTLVKAAEELKQFGARNVYANITHPVFSKDAIKKIESSSFTKVFVSDSIPIDSSENKIVTQISIAPLLTVVVKNLAAGESLANLFLPNKSYIEQYGKSKVINVDRIFPEFERSAKLEIPIDTKVYVTSKNNIKVKATKEMLGIKQIIGQRCESGVSNQPIGLEEAMLGANNRIEDLKKHKDYDGNNSYIVSIESFFIQSVGNNKPTDHALVLIEAPDGRRYKYLSPGIEIHKDIFKLVKNHDKSTVGQVLCEKYGTNASNWHAYVTDNEMSRYKQIIAAYVG